jgi:hypothetical protein
MFPLGGTAEISSDRSFVFVWGIPWTEVLLFQEVKATSTACIIVGLAAQQVDCPDLIRSPQWFLAHLWEASER